MYHQTLIFVSVSITDICISVLKCLARNAHCFIGSILLWKNYNHFFQRSNILITSFFRFYSFLPGAAYLLGYSQRQQRGPSHQATLVMALTSPRTCNMVLKLPEVLFPLSFTLGHSVLMKLKVNSFFNPLFCLGFLKIYSNIKKLSSQGHYNHTVGSIMKISYNTFLFLM